MGEAGCAGLVALERMLVCILKAMKSLKDFKQRGRNVSVGNGELQPSEGGGSHPPHQPGTGNWDSGPNIARPSNLPKESGN